MDGWRPQVAAAPAAALGAAAWMALVCAVLRLPYQDWVLPVAVSCAAGATAWLDSFLRPSLRVPDAFASRAAAAAALCALMAAVAAGAWVVQEGRSPLALPNAKDVALAALAVGAPCGALAAAAGAAALRVLQRGR